MRSHIFLLNYHSKIISEDRETNEELFEIVKLRICRLIWLANLFAAVLNNFLLPFLWLRIELRSNEVHSRSHAHQNEKVFGSEVEN